jgi:hypothetical protein
VDGEFSVYQFFFDNSNEPVLRHVDVFTAMRMAKRLTQSAGALVGVTQRIIITDGGDFTVFEWRFGPGVTWPTIDDLPPE